MKNTLPRLLTATALMALAGCSSALGSASMTVSPSSGPIGVPFAATFALNAEQTRILHDVTERGIASCMKDRGFAYQPLPYLPATAEADNTHIGDLDFARQHGYGLRYAKGQDVDSAASSNGGQAGLTAVQKEAYSKALLGEPIGPDTSGPTIVTIERADGSTRVRSDSCISIGTATVRGDLREWYAISAQLEDMVNDVRRRVQADPTFVAADRRWKDCMADAGLGRDSRNKRMESLMSDFTSGRRTAVQSAEEEKRIAVADATCVQTSGAADTLRGLFARYEKEVGDAHQGVLTRFAEMNRASVKRAQGHS